METGFYHPTRGYWQTTSAPSQAILDGYPDGTVEVPLKPSAAHEWDGSVWVEVTQDPITSLVQERAGMTCTPLQGILALGEANWKIILEYRATASWAEQVIIDSAQAWERNSQNIAFFQYLLDLSDEATDDLFRRAREIKA
jgi:hypothetical protein